MSRTRQRLLFVVTTLCLIVLAGSLLGRWNSSRDRRPASLDQSSEPLKRDLPQDKSKVLIFWAPFGNGHLSAARSLQADLESRNPNVEVILKDVTEFMWDGTRKIALSTFNNSSLSDPEGYHRWYEGYVKKAETLPSMGRTEVVQQYNLEALGKYLADTNPAVIVSTFNHAAEALIRLREEGVLPREIPLDWQHTDYVGLKYHARLAQALDLTFLPHEGIKESLIKKFGVSESQLVATGISVSESVKKPLTKQDQANFLTAKGLNPQVPTLTLMSGVNGVGDFAAMVKSIAQEVRTPLQIVAICAKNQKNYDALKKLQPSLPQNITVKAEGLVDPKDVASYLHSSEIFVGKAGGLSSTEVFTLGKSVVFLDNNGGQERYNIRYFEEYGLGRSIRKESELGPIVNELLKNPDQRQQMIDKQALFRSQFHPEQMAHHILKQLSAFEERFPNGVPLSLGALAQLKKETDLYGICMSSLGRLLEPLFKTK